MQDHGHEHQRPHPLLRILIPILGSDLSEILGIAWRLGKRIFGAKAHEGMYEALELDVQLELLDTGGKNAVVTKREQVRFLQDNIIAYQDQAWGDGDIFADYRCSPGVAVDRYRYGHLYIILISLREVKKRGDVEIFHINRTIENGFTKPVEDFQIDINHATRKASMSVIFPSNRLPKKTQLIEQNSTRTVPLDSKHQQTLPDGRQQITWSTDRPRLFEAYILRWEW